MESQCRERCHGNDNYHLIGPAAGPNRKHRHQRQHRRTGVCVCVSVRNSSLVLLSSWSLTGDWLLFLSVRCQQQLPLSSWLRVSWRRGTWAWPCSTVRKLSSIQNEPSSTPPSSTSSISLTIRSLPSTSLSSCPCVSPSCSHCSRWPPRHARGDGRDRTRRSEMEVIKMERSTDERAHAQLVH